MFRRSKGCPATTPTACAARIFTCHGGCTTRRTTFARGYHIELGGNFRYPSVGAFHGACNEHEGFGKTLKDHIQREYGATVGVTGRGEMIPNDQSFCEIDPSVVDRWGIPVLRFHFAWGEEEHQNGEAHGGDVRPILKTMGGKVRGVGRTMAETSGISIGGTVIHELGTARMGKDPQEFGGGRILPRARSQESVSGRWRAVREQSRIKIRR